MLCLLPLRSTCPAEHGGTAYPEIKVLFTENPELFKGYLIKVHNRSKCDFTCFACCKEIHISRSFSFLLPESSPHFLLTVGNCQNKLMSHLLRTQSSEVLPLKPGVVQFKAKHAMLTARNFFLANFYLLGPFTFNFVSKISPEFFLC